MLGQLDRPRDDVVRADDLVDGTIGQRLRGSERLALQNRHQGSVGADQSGQSLGAATARVDAQEYLWLADEKLPIGHDPQITRPGEFRAQTKGRTIKRRNV